MPLETVPNVPDQIGCYQFKEQIGEGAFSVVYRAVSEETGNEYAIKVFPKSNLKGPKDEERFQREVNAMAFMKHDNIISLYDIISDNENFYLVMDLCSESDLSRYIHKNGKIDEPTAAEIFRQLVSAVLYCHSAGIAHRDLKPENILIDKFPHVKISDFGMCGYTSDKKLMDTFCGSPCFCAPEVLCGVPHDGRLADIWSLGVILFVIVTGNHPWPISSTSVMTRNIIKGNYTIPKYLSEDCKALLSAMLKINPKERRPLEVILSNPWIMKSPNDSKSQLYQTSGEPPISLEDLSNESAKNSQHFEFDHGIISPFDNKGKNYENDATVRPKRASSLVDIQLPKESRRVTCPLDYEVAEVNTTDSNSSFTSKPIPLPKCNMMTPNCNVFMVKSRRLSQKYKIPLPTKKPRRCSETIFEKDKANLY